MRPEVVVREAGSSSWRPSATASAAWLLRFRQTDDHVQRHAKRPDGDHEAGADPRIDRVAIELNRQVGRHEGVGNVVVGAVGRALEGARDERLKDGGGHRRVAQEEEASRKSINICAAAAAGAAADVDDERRHRGRRATIVRRATATVGATVRSTRVSWYDHRRKYPIATRLTTLRFTTSRASSTTFS